MESGPIHLQIPEFSSSHSLKPGDDGSLCSTNPPEVTTAEQKLAQGFA